MTGPRGAPALALRVVHGSETLLAGGALVLIALLPLAEMVARRGFGVGVPGSGPVVQHLTLWIAFVGAALAARERRLLAVATTELLPPAWRRAAGLVAGTAAAGVSMLLARGSLDLVLIERQAETTFALGIPVWIAQAVIPAGFGAIAVRSAWRADVTWPGRAVAASGLALGLLLGQFPALLAERPAWPGLLLIVIATGLGMPLFAALGGAAALLFMSDGVPLAALPAETYRLAVSPTLAAIPLFTLAGCLLAEGQASQRLLRVFRAFFGWLPGGTAVVVAMIFAFFTIFTGGSGVTILALGALAYQALQADGYRPRFSVGLLTGSASLGLLLPPALPLILYGIVAEVSIEDLFIGGFLPGLLLIALVSAWGVHEAWRTGIRRQPFRPREALAALAEAKWDLLLPVVVLVAIFGGFATLIEAAALTAAYAFAMETLIHRDLSVQRDLVRVLHSTAVLLGGVLIILAVAMGLTSYLVDAQVPTRALEWVQGRVESRVMFLLLLNLLLLVVGCLMDIFSATVVVVPLIVPLGVAFGVDPIHLGIIFIANLELGYMTPPVGLNLFLASYRFERSLGEVARSAVPVLLIMAAGVVLITYVPTLTLGLLRWLGR